MERADYKLLPLVALGLGKAALEMVVMPTLSRVASAIIPKMELPTEAEIEQMIADAAGE